MSEYPSRLVEIIYHKSGVKLSTAERIAKAIEGDGFLLVVPVQLEALSDEEITTLLTDDYNLREAQLLPNCPNARNKITPQNVEQWVPPQDIKLVKTISKETVTHNEAKFGQLYRRKE